LVIQFDPAIPPIYEKAPGSSPGAFCCLTFSRITFSA